MSSLATMLTVGVIASRTHQPIHRIEYLIKSRGIAALAMAGNARVYSEDALEAIVQELHRIDSVRSAEAQATASRPKRVAAKPELVGSAGGL
jgi:hypothetical protein